MATKLQVWDAYLLKRNPADTTCLITPKSVHVISRVGWAIPIVAEQKAVFIDPDSHQQEIVDIRLVVLDGEHRLAKFEDMDLQQVVDTWLETQTGLTVS